MKKILKDLYGTGILFFYFLKWPYFFFFPYLYINGLDNNYILNILWIYVVGLIIKDFYMMYKKRR